ncbi:uncharacterized protein CcaverHIS019_0502400 [Cutaneotrichosporon cavernicola]|uniref:RNI-like protein n=1 Tax=Cutaneotrichosporon cavernicola TaxID=279322 RepID=A0AA48QWW2_9TREE|nr:uncharacterized protein CcaverHIS019_0502400 [Cutaneotrichosporon cavernicola]BEI92612.1 hypothetical protein CcaverHIS019_0502400 [Cutaneotrichosporon cavernicola]BEJ00387.1 hypothetical protein CcaverHIS631_0502440 [Cutaneotrichosporon cavernicola]BEJ08157.1 hypothetical protein CcaverHIS641_0502420 [Cutaneotrichosporon cavernicola]
MHTTAAQVANPNDNNKLVGFNKQPSPAIEAGTAHQRLQADDDDQPEQYLPRLDQIPVEVLSLIASLVAPPFYLPPPPDEPLPTPQAHVIASLDPSPPAVKTVSQALSATTKTCSHVLDAARPWLWEDVDVRSGRGWLAVVDALTEEVVEESKDDVEMAVVSLESSIDGGNLSRVASVTGSDEHSPMPERMREGAQPVAGPSNYAGAYTSSPIDSMNPVELPLPVSVPVGTGHGRSVVGRTVTINTTVAQNYFRPNEPSSSKSPGMRYDMDTSPPPQPHRLHMLLTPPGSRTTSPAGVAYSAHLRGRSRSPRRQLSLWDAEGISSVLQRSMSLSLPNGTRPFMRNSSLSHSRVVHEADSDDDSDDSEPNDHSESLRTAMRTPPPEEEVAPLTPEPEEDLAANANPELLPPPGPYIRHLSFTNFRTIGSRRSQQEAVRGRFVTAGRLEGVLKNTPNLRSLCMTEYVDSSLSPNVVEEIFFRGYSKPRILRNFSRSPDRNRRARGESISQPQPQSQSDNDEHALDPLQTTIDDQMDPPRPTYVPYEVETDEDMWKRRQQFTPLEALDLTGCVSFRFAEAIEEFGDNWLNLGPNDDEGRGRSRSRRFVTEATDDDDETEVANRAAHRPLFTALRRLSLRACTNLPSQFITHLILATPNLTHLDLSGTRVSDNLLSALTQHPPPGMQLQSLSLARCARLDPSCVVDFLVESPAARNIVDLNLFVNPTQGNAIGSYDLKRLLTSAPCIKSGMLRYLDLSSAAFTAEHLSPEVFPPQPSLVTLGLSHVATLPLKEIQLFLARSAPGVEVITLTGSSIMDLRPDASALQITLSLHALLINPLTTVPFSFSSINMSGNFTKADLTAGPTRLRVVELSSSIRRSLDPSQGSGRTEWQVVKSKGGRGWYVDVSAGWIPSSTVDEWGYVQKGPAIVGDGLGALSFVRHLPANHPRRRYLTQLAEANGRVRSDVGWHSRKMEVVRGEGMMGREEGMGGVGAFAFEE